MPDARGRPPNSWKRLERTRREVERLAGASQYNNYLPESLPLPASACEASESDNGEHHGNRRPDGYQAAAADCVAPGHIDGVGVSGSAGPPAARPDRSRRPRARLRDRRGIRVHAHAGSPGVAAPRERGVSGRHHARFRHAGADRRRRARDLRSAAHARAGRGGRGRRGAYRRTTRRHGRGLSEMPSRVRAQGHCVDDAKPMSSFARSGSKAC